MCERGVADGRLAGFVLGANLSRRRVGFWKGFCHRGKRNLVAVGVSGKRLFDYGPDADEFAVDKWRICESLLAIEGRHFFIVTHH